MLSTADEKRTQMVLDGLTACGNHKCFDCPYFIHNFGNTSSYGACREKLRFDSHKVITNLDGIIHKYMERENG